MTPFKHGLVRATTLHKIRSYRSAGGEKAYSTSFEGMVEVIIRSGGDHKKIEKILAVEPGTITSGDGVIAIVEARGAPDTRLPSGKEGGTNDDWRPGGYTKFGIPEVVADLRSAPFVIVKIENVLDWVKHKNFGTNNPKLTRKDIEELKVWMTK